VCPGLDPGDITRDSLLDSHLPLTNPNWSTNLTNTFGNSIMGKCYLQLTRSRIPSERGNHSCS
jgi:hypothetical protein